MRDSSGPVMGREQVQGLRVRLQLHQFHHLVLFHVIDGSNWRVVERSSLRVTLGEVPRLEEAVIRAVSIRAAVIRAAVIRYEKRRHIHVVRVEDILYKLANYHVFRWMMMELMMWDNCRHQQRTKLGMQSNIMNMSNYCKRWWRDSEETMKSWCKRVDAREDDDWRYQWIKSVIVSYTLNMPDNPPTRRPLTVTTPDIPWKYILGATQPP